MISQAKAPPGSLEAAKEGDYELWISKQLRLNRIQACSTTVKEDLVRSLRSATALSDVTAVVEGELRQLLFARNGVGDMARSTLIAGEWDELLPISGVKRRVRVLGAPDSGRTVIEREVRFLGPALGLASVFDAVALDSTTLRLRRRVSGARGVSLIHTSTKARVFCRVCVCARPVERERESERARDRTQ